MLRAFICGLAFVAVTLGATEGRADLSRLFAPKAELVDEIWLERDAASQVAPDHGAWNALLRRYVATDAKGVNRVAYGAVSDADRRALTAYIAALEEIDPATLAPAEQMAFWINLYNAATLALVLEHYPLASIRDIGSGLFEDGPWDRPVATVQGRALTLNQIEHGILRPVYQDARVHFAVNCASVGCPNLANAAYTGATLEAQLAEAERAYVNDPRGVRDVGGELVLSSIFNWFREDFAESEAALLAYLKGVAGAETRSLLEARGEIGDYAYDWSLNGQ